MTLVEIILFAIALGIDCLVVSFCQGLVFTKNRTKNSLALALTMGGFQGGMPVISYLATGLVSNYLTLYTKWIVFAIFMFLGVKFLYEAFNEKEECPICNIDFKCLILMGVATSIDALGAGVGLKLTATPLLEAVLIIGFASFVMSLTGFWAGNKFKSLPTKYLEIAGGLILIGLAIKSLL